MSFVSSCLLLVPAAELGVSGLDIPLGIWVFRASSLFPAAVNAITSRMKLVRKTEVWRPTRWGFLLIFLLIGVLAVGLISTLYPFLAQNAPVPQPELIIIEGWLGDAELASVLANDQPGALWVVTGGPIQFGASLFEEKTYAEVSAVRLRKLGIPPEAIIVASAPNTSKNRTYVSALAVREKLEEAGLFGRPANLYTLGAHSRRSFFLYRRAFGPDAPLGVVSLESTEYDLHRWCCSSLAFRHVVSEWIAWFYVQCTRWRY